MSADYNIQLAGLNETILYLNKFDPLLVKILQEEAKIRFRPLAKAIGKEFPKFPKSLNGEMRWRRGTGYTSGKKKGGKGNSHFPLWANDAQTKVDIVSSTGSKKSFARVQQMSASGSVFDSAKKSDVTSFINALDFAANSSPHGTKSRSRIMFPQTKKNLPMIEKEVQLMADKIGAEITRKLGGKL